MGGSGESSHSALENLQILEVYGGQVSKALDYGPKTPGCTCSPTRQQGIFFFFSGCTQLLSGGEKLYQANYPLRNLLTTKSVPSTQAGCDETL